MTRPVLTLAAILSLGLAGPALAKATPCKDPKTGKFIKCPPPAAAATTGKKPVCRDSKGHFAKCGTPGASQPK